MGFLSNIFGRKPNSKSFPGSAFYEEILNLIVISDTLKRDLKEEIKQAFENPKSFYDENSKFILSDRGLTYPKDALLTPKFVLIDTLQDNGQMAEVDWRGEESEVRLLLNEMRMAKNYDFILSDDDLYEGCDTGEIIELIDEKELKPQRYSITLLNINSDCYIFTVVPLDIKQKVEILFEKDTVS